MMIIDNCYLITPENGEEVNLANEVILKYREEKAREEKIQKAKESISLELGAWINIIGLDEVKNIVHELRKELANIERGW